MIDVLNIMKFVLATVNKITKSMAGDVQKVAGGLKADAESNAFVKFFTKANPTLDFIHAVTGVDFALTAQLEAVSDLAKGIGKASGSATKSLNNTIDEQIALIQKTRSGINLAIDPGKLGFEFKDANPISAALAFAKSNLNNLLGQGMPGAKKAADEPSGGYKVPTLQGSALGAFQGPFKQLFGSLNVQKEQLGEQKKINENLEGLKALVGRAGIVFS